MCVELDHKLSFRCCGITMILISKKSSFPTSDLVFDLSLTHERWGAAEDPSKMGQLRHPANLNMRLQEAREQKC